MRPPILPPGSTALRPDTTLASSGPSGTVASGSGTFTFSSPEPEASFECRVYEAGTTTLPSFEDCSGNGTHAVSGLAEGTYTFEVRALEPFSEQADPTPASRTWTVDTTAPTADSTTPDSGATGVARNTNLTATFSEKMNPASISKSTFKLYKCSSTTSTTCTSQVTNVSVTLSTDGLTATLNPYGTSSSLLGSNTKYKAIVSTGAKDVAGNALDQSSSTSGNQQKEWYFTTGSS